MAASEEGEAVEAVAITVEDSDNDGTAGEGEPAALQPPPAVGAAAPPPLLKPLREVPMPTGAREVVEDFVRNFLFRNGMQKTLDCFQEEWYDLYQRGLVSEDDPVAVPTCYAKNQLLLDKIAALKAELASCEAATSKAVRSQAQVKKECDYHRLQHRQISREKANLMQEIKRLHEHYAELPRKHDALQQKYEAAMRAKMLTRLDRDRAVDEAAGLQTTIKRLQTGQARPGPAPPRQLPRHSLTTMQQTQPLPKAPSTTAKPADSEMPPNRQPDAKLLQPPAAEKPITVGCVDKVEVKATVKAHDQAVSGVAAHPTKAVVATVSDDSSFKVWTVPSGELLFDGTGHTDWIAACEFSPDGNLVATASGDSTVKIWDLGAERCSATFSEHAHAVWDCSFHFSGSFLASGSMDGTAKIWDLGSMRCRTTLRGHKDSINSISYQQFSSSLITGSADRTVRAWDQRSGLSTATLQGHDNAISCATFNRAGTHIASADLDGVVIVWDVRSSRPLLGLNAGPHPANKCAFNHIGDLLAVASDDGRVKLFDPSTSELLTELYGHNDAVQHVAFDATGQSVISASSDCTFRVWGL